MFLFSRRCLFHLSLLTFPFSGCGSYKCPPFHVACLFKKVLWRYRFAFKKVIFAILEDHKALMHSFGNFRPFEFVLTQSGGSQLCSEVLEEEAEAAEQQ